MFTYPATSLYNSVGSYTVVWSQEEFDQRIAEGWTEEPQPVEASVAPVQPAPSLELLEALMEGARAFVPPAQPNKNKKK